MVAVPAGVDATNLNRLQLPQGDLALLHNSNEPIHFLAWIELKSGTIRGNHVHRVKKEFLYLMDGTVLLHLKETSSDEHQILQLTAGDLVTIEPGIAHA